MTGHEIPGSGPDVLERAALGETESAVEESRAGPPLPRALRPPWLLPSTPPRVSTRAKRDVLLGVDWRRRTDNVAACVGLE
jgi:hypothetical protein